MGQPGEFKSILCIKTKWSSETPQIAIYRAELLSFPTNYSHQMGKIEPYYDFEAITCFSYFGGS